ncbi:MAG: hypothetical protein RL208_505 [Pseudomonadota bacterium]|jgi:hypothetical protein
MMILNRKNIFAISLSIFIFFNRNVNAEISTSFSLGKVHDLFFKKDKEERVVKNDKEENKNEQKETTEEKTGEDDVFLKLKIGGMLEGGYTHLRQEGAYIGNVLPNGQSFSPQFKPQNGHFANDNVMHMRSKIELNPEFLHKPSQIKAGVKIITPLFLQNINHDSDPKTANEEYIYFDSKYMRFELGSTFSSASKMRVDPEKLASGTGGVYGDWWRYVSFPVFNTSGLSGADASVLNAYSPSFIIYPVLPNEAGFTVQRSLFGNITSTNFSGGSMLYGGSQMQGLPTQGARSNKVSFYTKRKYGLQLGYSYSPTTESNGYIFSNAYSGGYGGLIGGYVRDYMSFGLNYKEQFGDFGVGLSFTHEIGKVGGINMFANNVATGIDSSYTRRNDLNASAYGLQLSYKNFVISYTYGDWRRSLLTENAVLSNGSYALNNQAGASSYHVLGAGYNFGPINLGFTYMNSNMAGNELQVWSLGTDLKMMSLRYFRFQPYFEFTYFMFNPRSYYLNVNSNTRHEPLANKGYVILTGIRVTF